MIPHGTANGYVHHRCRCDLCHEAKKARDAKYRAANRERRRAESKAYARARAAELRELRVEMRAIEDQETLLRDALEHVWGSLPMSEVVLLPQRVRDVCISNHTRLEHPELLP